MALPEGRDNLGNDDETEQPLDLTMVQEREKGRPNVPVNRTAISFVTPLDLSLNRETRPVHEVVSTQDCILKVDLLHQNVPSDPSSSPPSPVLNTQVGRGESRPEDPDSQTNVPEGESISRLSVDAEGSTGWSFPPSLPLSGQVASEYRLSATVTSPTANYLMGPSSQDRDRNSLATESVEFRDTNRTEHLEMLMKEFEQDPDSNPNELSSEESEDSEEDLRPRPSENDPESESAILEHSNEGTPGFDTLLAGISLPSADSILNIVKDPWFEGDTEEMSVLRRGIGDVAEPSTSVAANLKDSGPLGNTEYDPREVIPETPLAPPGPIPAIRDALRGQMDETETPRKYVFCPTRLAKNQVSKLRELCYFCDGSVVRDYDEEVTHLILNLENGRVPQTLKYLFGIADKKWIVTFDWVEESIKQRAIVSEEPFETSSFPNTDAGVRRSRMTPQLLFRGLTFHAPEVLKSSGISLEDSKKLLKKLGARVVERLIEGHTNLLILGDLRMKSQCQEWFETKRWVTVTWEWVLDCILTYDLIEFRKSHLVTELDPTSLPDVILQIFKK